MVDMVILDDPEVFKDSSIRRRRAPSGESDWAPSWLVRVSARRVNPGYTKMRGGEGEGGCPRGSSG